MAGILSMGLPGDSMALTMTFEDVPSGTALHSGDSYIEDGMKITVYDVAVSMIGSPLTFSADNGLYFHGDDAYMTFEMVDGSTFDLNSFDFATNGYSRWITTSNTSLDILLPVPYPTATYETLYFTGSDFENISWFSVRTAFRATEMDNITITEHTVDPVPEPATMLLFGTGVAGLAGNSWRKKRIRKQSVA